MELSFEIMPGQKTAKVPIKPESDSKIQLSFQVYQNGVWLDGTLTAMDHWSDNNWTSAMYLGDRRLGNCSVLTVNEYSGVSVGMAASAFDLHLQFHVRVE